MTDAPCQHLRIEALRQQLAQWEGAASWRQSLKDLALKDPASLERLPALSSGCPALDRALPEKGFRPGTLVEWLGRGEGDGTATLALRAAAGASPRRRGGGRARSERRVLSLGGGCPRDRAWPADRRSSGQQGRPCLGLGPGVALSGRGGGGRLAGSAGRKTRWPHFPPAATGRGTRRRPGPVDPAGKRAFPALLGRRATAGRTAAKPFALWSGHPAGHPVPWVGVAADARRALALPRRRAPCTHGRGRRAANRRSGDRS